MMLNFDEVRFLESQRNAVSCAEQLHSAVGSLLDRGADNLLFVGAGGAGILMWPAASLLATSSRFPSRVELPAELVTAGSALLSERSIVVMPSRSGDTPETLEALDYCRKAGATVIALTGTPDSPLAMQADVNVTNPVGDDNSSESFYIQSIFLALSLMSLRGEIADYPELLAGAAHLPDVMLEAKRAFETRAGEIATELAQGPFHIVVGAGPTWAEAMYYGMCILEEMQWILTRPVHAAEFFHGPLELVEGGVSCVLLKGEDPSRGLVDRVESFVRAHTDRVIVIDSAVVETPGVSEQLRRLMSPAILATLLERVSAHLEVVRGHPLTTRRYYRTVSY
jgi:fructoselysine-6-phosphate deglycase